VRNNNFTQQTNALDVDKHMYVLSTTTVSFGYSCFVGRMAYIEENLKLLREQQQAGGSRDATAEADGSGKDEVSDMVKLGEKYKTASKEVKEGSVTASLAMLSAIPEVDLGME
jgi:Hepatocellular carcinoma-associated antigen 59